MAANGTSSPQWHRDAEQSVLGAVLLRNDSLPRAHLDPLDFFELPHQHIWRSMQALHKAGSAIDTVTMEVQLNGAPVPLGYLSECVHVVPTAENIEYYAAIVREDAITRRVQLALSDLLHVDLEGEALLRATEARVAMLTRSTPPPERLEPALATWAALDPTFLTTCPPHREWLLKHPTRNGEPCPPNDGDGLLPRGKVGVFASAGGAGKTHALISLAVCVVTGHLWLGHFQVDWMARRGKVFLALAEEDAEEVWRRIYGVAQFLRLSAEQRALVAERIVILPLAGIPVGLVTFAADGRTVIASALLEALRARLVAEAGPDGWSLVVIDPLARFAGPDVESDNAIATRFVQCLETLTTVPGKPTVLTAHHSSKGARTAGSVDSRGVTAITDGARWAATLRADGDSVYFQQVKSNYSRPMPEELRLVHEVGGLLRAASDEELEAIEARKSEAVNARLAVMEEAVFQGLLAAVVSITTRDELTDLVPGDRNLRVQAVTRLLSRGRVFRDPPGRAPGGVYRTRSE